MASVQESAEAFMRSYASRIAGNTLMEAENEADFDAQLEKLCAHLLSHFCERPISFGRGPLPAQWESHKQGAVWVKAMIRRYIEVGVGFQLTLKELKVTVLMDYGTHGACIVQPTWTVIPPEKSAIEPWNFQGAYGYRKLPTGQEWWEYAYVDDEVVQTKKRFPHFFDALVSPPT